MPAKKAKSEFSEVFARLRSILVEYEPKLAVLHDRPGYYFLNTHTIGPNKQPIMFGGVRTGKAYVSYYLMCVYTGHAREGMSPALKKRMQGKSCFNFKSVDDELFGELREVTRRGYDAWKAIEWVD